MSRKPPKLPTIKKLFGLSGNQCATPDCNNLLIEDDVILGEICHIEAAEKGWARYNPESNDEYRRSFENLILLCEKCHKKIDADEKKYDAGLLKSWKNKHENRKNLSTFKISGELATQSIKKSMQQYNTNTSSGGQINNQADTMNIGMQIGSVSISSKKKRSLNLEDARKIIPEYKNKIDFFKQKLEPAETTVIDYQDDLKTRNKRDVYLIETKHLRYRKENGRIKADVISYEQMKNIELLEENDEHQEILRSFLEKNDPEKKEVLKRQLKAKGQREPAIITCDGFLINGNRRKMAFEELYRENNQSSEFEKMRVVILDEDLTELNVRKIENREQMQDEGKSEYHGLNKALTARSNELVGYTLHAQLSDDPEHVGKNKKELDRAVKKFRKDYIWPLECAERYIEYFNKSDIYNSISGSKGDSEGRWQAFIDYGDFYYSVLENPQQRIKSNISESDIGKIEDVAFKLIRKRTLGRGLGKLHLHLRPATMKKYFSNEHSRKALFKIVNEVETDLPKEQKVDENGNLLPEAEIDKKWGAKYERKIVGNLRFAKESIDVENERGQPLEYIRAAYNKLTHDNLDIKKMAPAHYPESLDILDDISDKVSELRKEVNKWNFKLKQLTKKGK